MSKMIRTAGFLAVGLIAGFAVATLLQPDDAEMGFDAVPLPLAARLEDLERRLDWESDARLALMDEIDALRAELDAVATAASADEPGTRLEELARAARAALGRDGEVSPAREPGALAAEVAERVAERRRRFQPTPEELEQRRIQRFVDAGITPDRAEWIAQRTAELQMQALEAQYEAARSGDTTRVRSVPAVDDALRAELGDAEYERYLTALGRSTRVGVRNVLPSSPAAQAGLQPGDQVVAYAGRRVFDMSDLNRLTLEGQPGETVVIDVVRDGQTLQLFVPRGPVGITGGGRRRQ